MTVEEVELEAPKRNEVLVKIGAAGICRSDLHFLKGEAMYPFLPAIPGHEGSGTVETVGEDFPFENAALVGCSVTTGVGAALYTAKVTPGSSVVVVGSGGVGLNVIQGARIAGAAKIVALDVIDERLEFALTFGATHTVNANDE